MPDNRIALAEGGVPVCPYCGCTRHDSEPLHDGNVMSHAELVDAMLIVFLRDPEDTRPSGIWPNEFPGSYHDEAVTRFRAKMDAALGVAVRNMPYLAGDLPGGLRILSPGHLPMPQNAEEAKAMWLFGERWMRDNAPDALRADHDAGGAVAMREAAARWHDDQAAEYDREATERTLPDGSWAGRDAMWARADAQDHRSHAAAIRALPLASQEGSEC